MGSARLLQMVSRPTGLGLLQMILGPDNTNIVYKGIKTFS